jgi:DNA-binding PadR family transcriptional regulator
VVKYQYSVLRYIAIRNIDQWRYFLTDKQPFLPLSEISFYILLSLAPSAKHGYAILKDVEELSRGTLRLSTSTLYDALERLLKQELIARVEEENAQVNGRIRKTYHLNEVGRRVLAAEASRMQVLLEVATPRLNESNI